jgi:AraC-like DNA-binding protein
MPPFHKEIPDALSPAAVPDERVKTVMLLIEKDGYSKTAVQKTAGSVYLSVSRLSHLFKEYTGLSPFEYAKCLKLERARRLVEESQARIKEIAAVVGYNDPKRFIRDFKTAYGVTPRQFRKRSASPDTAHSDRDGPRSE